MFRDLVSNLSVTSVYLKSLYTSKNPTFVGSLKSAIELKNMAKVSYTNAVGCLMYAMVYTRSDLAQAVSQVSKYMSNPERGHWDAVK